MRQVICYKLRQNLLQIATVVTNCDKVVTNCDSCYKLRQSCYKLRRCCKLRHNNGYKKDNIKQLVKIKINTSVNNEICEASQQKTKLRFIKEYSQKQHISELGFERCKMMMKIRLNMIATKCNYKGIYK